MALDGERAGNIVRGFVPDSAVLDRNGPELCGFVLIERDKSGAHNLTENKENQMLMADGVGFEPTVGLHPRRFSRPLP
jgi:hypothetical protein